MFGREEVVVTTTETRDPLMDWPPVVGPVHANSGSVGWGLGKCLTDFPVAPWTHLIDW